MYDVIIENGRILDGTGSPWFKADVGVKDGKIATIGELKEAQAVERIDAQGDVVSPGFIDIHTHSDAVLFAEPREKGKILQGVTTEVIGNCGIDSRAHRTRQPGITAEVCLFGLCRNSAGMGLA